MPSHSYCFLHFAQSRSPHAGLLFLLQFNLSGNTFVDTTYSMLNSSLVNLTAKVGYYNSTPVNLISKDSTLKMVHPGPKVSFSCHNGNSAPTLNSLNLCSPNNILKPKVHLEKQENFFCTMTFNIFITFIYFECLCTTACTGNQEQLLGDVFLYREVPRN